MGGWGWVSSVGCILYNRKFIVIIMTACSLVCEEYELEDG